MQRGETGKGKFSRLVPLGPGETSRSLESFRGRQGMSSNSRKRNVPRSRLGENRALLQISLSAKIPHLGPLSNCFFSSFEEEGLIQWEKPFAACRNRPFQGMALRTGRRMESFYPRTAPNPPPMRPHERPTCIWNKIKWQWQIAGRGISCGEEQPRRANGRETI